MLKPVKFFSAIIFASIFSLSLSKGDTKAASIDEWNYFKNHPCVSGDIIGTDMYCGGSVYGESFAVRISVPMVYKPDKIDDVPSQLPEVTFVYSMTAFEFDWAPLPFEYVQDVNIPRVWVVPGKEYYDNIKIHPYLYQIVMPSFPNTSRPTNAKIGDNILISSPENLGLGDYYSSDGSGTQVGVGIGSPFDEIAYPGKMKRYYEMSLAKYSPDIGPSFDALWDKINKPHSFDLNNKSGSPTNALPYYDFDTLYGAWFLSTLSSVYGNATVGTDTPAFPLTIEYKVEIRAWAEPTSHFIKENRMVAPEERGWVCRPASYYVPYPFGCNPGGGSRYGYWSWEVVKEAQYLEAFWEHPIDPAKDWGGVSSGGFWVPTADASSNCPSCSAKITQWMLPDLSGTSEFCAIPVYESRPLPDQPW